MFQYVTHCKKRNKKLFPDDHGNVKLTFAIN